MSRLKDHCPGDCAICPLLAENRVEMVPCVLDQLFRRIQKQEKMLDKMAAMIEKTANLPFASDCDAEDKLSITELET